MTLELDAWKSHRKAADPAFNLQVCIYVYVRMWGAFLRIDMFLQFLYYIHKYILFLLFCTGISVPPLIHTLLPHPPTHHTSLSVSRISKRLLQSYPMWQTISFLRSKSWREKVHTLYMLLHMLVGTHMQEDQLVVFLFAIQHLHTHTYRYTLSCRFHVHWNDAVHKPFCFGCGLWSNFWCEVAVYEGTNTHTHTHTTRWHSTTCSLTAYYICSHT